jgi:mannosyltransferase
VPAVSATASAPAAAIAAERRLAAWWPLAGLVVLAAGLRLSTLGLQSFWYDEAFTPVHVLHSSLWATLRSVAHTENTPPLWYVIVWGEARLLGTGELALRLPSALAGVATVAVAWAIGRELAGARAGLLAGAFVAVNPLFVWYSQEARAYALFVLAAALAMLCFLRAEREPTPRRMAAFALTGSLALLTHYFAVFLLIPMVLWLLSARATRRAALGAIAALTVLGLALLPLISAQGGHGTQWIGRWALSSRLQAIPQYYLTGYSGAPLGHGVELLVALPILAGASLGVWHLRTLRRGARERYGALLALLLASGGVLIPIALAALGADYLAPRNLVGAMVAVTALIAVLLASIDRAYSRGADPPGPGPSEGVPVRQPALRAPRRSPGARGPGAALAAAIALAFLAVSIDVELSPRLQRGNWREVARELGGGTRGRALTTVELGAAPLEYYIPRLHNLARGASVSVGEIDEIGYAPLRRGAGRPPAPGFQLADRLDIDGLIVYRFLAPAARVVSETGLRRHVITLARPEVLVPAGARISFGGAHSPSQSTQPASSGEKT